MTVNACQLSVACVVRILYKFQTGMPVRFELADGPNVFSAVLLTVSDETGNAEKIERIMIREIETL